MSIKMIILLFSLFPELAYGYIGPGMGAGALASVVGIVSALFLGIFAVLYYPIKRLIKKRRGGTPLEAEEQEE